MEKRSHLPIKGHMLNRPRLSGLLQEALDFPCVTVIAGNGYGKTQALAKFASQTDRRLIWLHITEMENREERFWQSLAQAARYDLPQLAAGLTESHFPRNSEERAACFRLFAEAVYSGEPVLWVLDDYSSLENQEIRGFIQFLLRAEIEGLCIILVSVEKADYNASGLRNTGGVYHIGLNELRFTREEIADYFASRGITAGPAEAEHVFTHTDGWPFAVYQYVSHRRRKSAVGRPITTHLALAAEYFEYEYYQSFKEPLRRMLVKLSMFEAFSIGIVNRVYDGDDLPQAISQLSRHAFITFDYTTDLFVFQRMYRSFLQKKLELLPIRERDLCTDAAAHWFMENNYQYEAASAYAACRNYAGLLHAVECLPKGRMTATTAGYVLSLLQTIPEEQRTKNAHIGIASALLHFNNAHLNEVKAICTSLTQNLTPLHDSQSRKLLGEVYAIQADVSMQENTLQFAQLFQEAAKLLPDGSTHRTPCNAYIDNNDFFFLPDDPAYTPADMVRIVFDTIPYVEKISGRYGYGAEWLFAAEERLHTEQMSRVAEAVQKALHKAGERGQWDIVLNALFVMLRTSIYYADFNQVQEILTRINTIADREEYPGLRPLRDTLLGWFYARMGDLHRVPLWDAQEGQQEYPVGAGRNVLISAFILAQKGNHQEAAVMLERMDLIFEQRKLWLTRLNCYIIRSICQLKLGNKTQAIDDFWSAYQMAYGRGITLPFTELGNVMRSLADHALKDARYPFDPAWLEDIVRKASSYAKRFAALTGQYERKNQSLHPKGPKLSAREQEVLRYLAQGMLREEIAEMMDISVNGIKKHITGIYNKLGAVNRSDALRLAALHGYLA